MSTVSKVGLSATEYVRGTFDARSGLVKMHGVRKVDPNILVILDSCNLNLASDGKLMKSRSKSESFSLRR